MLKRYIGLPVWTEGERLQRRRAMLIDRRVRIFRWVELIDDVDCLGSHAHLRHERIERDDLFLLQTGLRNEIVKLDSEHDLTISAKLHAEFLRHRSQILLLVKRLAE